MSRLTALFLLWLALPLSAAAAGSQIQAIPAADDGKAISEVKLIGGSSSEISSLKSNAKQKGWTVIESNLNAGTSGDVIYLCYKTSTDGDYITGLYLSSTSNSSLPSSITVGGKRYSLCPYEGGSHFTGIKGDLNSNAGGEDIHIYYTKDSFSDNRAVTQIWFNATSKGAVNKDSSSTPYDVNKGAGGDDIFMHFSTTAGASTEKPAASDNGKSEGKSTVGKAISEVKLIGGSSSEISSLKSNAKQKGWTVIESNLNAGTSGDVIYLCYKTSTDGDYITGLYLSSTSNSSLPSSITVGGKRYSLCPYEGGSHFTGIKGDLNSNAGGEDIHIYYTKDSFSDNRAVTQIWFNATSKGAVNKDSSSTPYDVNKGAGGDDIFMHFSTEK